MPLFWVPPLGRPRIVLDFIFFLFGGLIKYDSRSQKVDFKSNREGVQIIERNHADRIYKAAETRKAVLLQYVSSPSSEFSLLISWCKVLHTLRNMTQNWYQSPCCVEGERDARRWRSSKANISARSLSRYFSNPLEFLLWFGLDPAIESNMKVNFEKFDGKESFSM